MNSQFVYSLGAFTLLGFAATNPAGAAEHQGEEAMEVIEVVGERPSLTNDPTHLSRARLAEVAGATHVIGPDERQGEVNVSITDAIAGTPGVIAQPFFGGNDQPRIQMRGSGLQQNPTQRGVLMLQDGLPLSRADGSYIVSSLEPDASNTIEIYRGATGARVGAATLGGAINFISLTGRDAQDLQLAAEGGSFGTVNGRVSYGVKQGAFDFRGNLVLSDREGYRAPYNDSERTSLLMNAGYRISDSLETRFYVDYVDLGFDVVGPLTLDALNNDPESVHEGPVVTPNPGGTPPFIVTSPGPNVPRDKPYREAEKLRLSARTTYISDIHEVDLGATFAKTDESFRFPVSAGVRATDGHDVALDLRYTQFAAKNSDVPQLELSAHYITGEHDRSYFHNNLGTAGSLFAENELSADTLSLNARQTLFFGDYWRLTAGLNYIYATRDNKDVWGASTRPTLRVGGPPPGPIPPEVPAVDTSFDRSYSGLNPSLSLAYAWKPGHMAFINLAGSYEPPTFEDLLVPTGGTPNSGPMAFVTTDLEAQSGYTLELGTRGHSDNWSWDVVGYYSWLKDELLSLRDATGVPLGTRNAEDTRRLGLELGFTADLSDSLWTRVSYTYQDFTFEGDPFFGNNDLAGAQPHTLEAKLMAEPFDGLTFGPTLTWVPSKTPVDNANTLYRDGYTTVGFQARYLTWSGRLSLYLDARNLFDERYASSSLITDVAKPTQAAFLPGDGRAAYVGFELRL